MQIMEIYKLKQINDKIHDHAKRLFNDYADLMVEHYALKEHIMALETELKEIKRRDLRNELS